MNSFTKKSFISLVLALIIVFNSIPFGGFTVEATDATAIYIIDTIGGESISITPSQNKSGNGWSWNASNKTLTLNGFNGEYIEATGDMTIKLVGTNTITVSGTEKHAIVGNYSDAEITINKNTSDTTDKLVINGNNVSSDGLIHGYRTKIKGGTLEINVTNNKDSGRVWGFYQNSGMYLENKANLKITLKGTGTHSSSLYGGNTLYTHGTGNVNINVSGNDYSAGIDYFVADEGSANVKISAESTDPNIMCHAIERLRTINDTTTINVDKGIVSTGYHWDEYLDVSSKVKIQPKNGAKKWNIIPIRVGSYWRHTILDATTGEPIADGLTFTPQVNEVPFAFEDSEMFDIPAGKVGESVATSYDKDFKMIFLKGGLKGINQNDNKVDYEIIDGSLPKGLKLEWGYISGTYEEEGPAGSVTIRATRRSDNATAELTINYGKVVEGEKFLNVGGTQVNLKNDASGEGWSYVGETGILTLNGYNGGPITSDKGLNIVLNGTNTINVEEGNEKYAILTEYRKNDGEIIINKKTSDKTDKLIIKGNNVSSPGLIYGNKTTLNGGTLEIDITKSNGNGRITGFYLNSGMYIKNKANLKITLKGTETDNSSLYGGNTLYTYGTGNINIKISGQDYSSGIDVLEAREGSSNISISVETTDLSADCHAIERLGEVNATSTINVDKGTVSTGYSWSEYLNVSSKVKIQPKNPERKWITLPIIIGSYWRHTILDATTGEPIADGLTFTPQANEVPFAFEDSEMFDIPAGKVGESVATSYDKDFEMIFLKGGLKGINQNDNKVDYEIIDGSLPKGLKLEWGYISGTYEEECSAGSVKIRATRRSDGSTAEFTINYGAVTVSKPIQSVTLNKHKITLNKYESEVLIAQVLPADATVNTVRWESSNPAVATVDNNGKVTAHKQGHATITVTTTQGQKKDKCEVTVPGELPFPDVMDDEWYFQYVKYVYEHGLMTGYTAGDDAGLFGVNDQITRGQIVTILYRMEGEPAVAGEMSFSDVKNPGEYYYNPVKWAAKNGIVTGYKEGPNKGKFLPNNPITREELAIILKRYADYKGKDTSQTADLTKFGDYKKVSDWAIKEMKWAVGVGIISGNKDTTPPTIKPQGNATRAEAATMITRFCENVM